MRSIQHFLSGLSILAVCACTPLAENSGRAARDIQENAYNTGNKLKEYFTFRPKTVVPPPPVPDRYCYRTGSDVLCYDHPLEGAETRLVGQQNGSGESVSVSRTVVSANDPVYVNSITTESLKPIMVKEMPAPKEANISVNVEPSHSLY